MLKEEGYLRPIHHLLHACFHGVNSSPSLPSLLHACVCACRVDPSDFHSTPHLNVYCEVSSSARGRSLGEEEKEEVGSSKGLFHRWECVPHDELQVVTEVLPPATETRNPRPET